MDEIKVIPASGEDWHAFIARAGQPNGATERVVLEVHQRLLAVESGVGGVAGNPGHAFAAPAPATADGLSPVEPAPQAQQGVTVEELAYILSEAPSGDLGAAYWLLKHRRLGPLLRGEGAPAPKRVVLPEEPPAPVSNPKWFFAGDFRYVQGRRDGWKAAYAEVERQQGGQADG